MQTFTYPLVFKLLYRYGNIPATIFLVIYLSATLSGLRENTLTVIPIIIILFLLYFINRRYIELYKILPYKIEIDDDKMICSDFFLSAKKVTVLLKNIDTLSGGVFDGKVRGLMKVFDRSQNMWIGFYGSLNLSSRLTAVILSKVKKNLYDEVVNKLKRRSGLTSGQEKK